MTDYKYKYPIIAPSKTYDIASLGDYLELPDPMLSTNWLVHSIQVGKSDSKGQTTLKLPEVIFPANWLRERVENVDLQFPYFDVEYRHLQATKKYYAGFNNVNTFNMTFYEDHLATTLHKFNSWRLRIVNDGSARANNGTKDASKTGNYRPPSLYKASIRMFLLSNIFDPDADAKHNQVVLEAAASGVWPSAVQPITLGSGTSERVAVQVTFSLDRMDIL